MYNRRTDHNILLRSNQKKAFNLLRLVVYDSVSYNSQTGRLSLYCKCITKTYNSAKTVEVVQDHVQVLILVQIIHLK